MKIVLIAAVDDDYGLSYRGKIPWHLPADFKHFKETTEGHVVIMGRKTWESLPPKFRPLPNRQNVVLTKDCWKLALSSPDFPRDVIISNELEGMLEYFKNQKKEQVFIIGGGEIYKAAIPYATDIILTEVAGVFETDTYFPNLDNDDTWDSNLINYYPADEKNSHNFRITYFIKNNE